MEIESIKHKALKRMVETGSTKGVVEPKRLARMLSAIVNASDIEELYAPPNFGLHPLKGDMAGRLAMTVTKNWRLTFVVTDKNTLTELNLEDYH